MRLIYLTITIVFLFFINNGSAQSQLWHSKELHTLDIATMKQIQHLPSRALLFQAAIDDIRFTLRQAADGASKQTISLPMPDGTFIEFRLTESSVMQAGIQRNHPEIMTYSAQSTNNPEIYGRIGVHGAGFFGLVSYGGKEVIIQQISPNLDLYFIYNVEDDVDAQLLLKTSLCGTEMPITVLNGENLQSRSSEKRMRHFRVAIATTSTFSADVGGTQTAVLNKIVEVLNGVNLRYNKDMGMHFDLIDKDTILFNLSKDSDYFKNTTNGGGLLAQNQSFLRSKLNNNEYDFSQVWTTSCTDVGGVVSGRACDNSGKARGVSCGPRNVAYFLTTAKHEMGHQFSASHTFNRCGESTQFASGGAYEPGSGSTIMAYPGACGTDNIAGDASDYFHVISIIQMTNFITNVEPDCGTYSDEINHTPDPILLLPNSLLTIPKSTPYELIGRATDPDNDNLVYNWEEFDVGNNEPLGTNEETGPLNRSYLPQKKDSLRLVPKFENILSGNIDIADRLPIVTRDMNWKFNTRDQNIKAGSTISLDYKFKVTGDAGPFKFTFPDASTDTILRMGQYVELVWDVANTDRDPVNADKVDILVTRSTLYNFTDTLVKGTPNDGREYVMIPYDGAKLRFKIKASNSIFLDLSKKSLKSVFPDSAGYSFDVYPHNALLCPANNPVIEIKTISWNNYATPITIEAVDGWPANTIISLDKTIINPGESAHLTIDVSQVDESGLYTIRLRGITPDQDTIWRYLDVEILGSKLLSKGVAAPLNGALAVSPAPMFEWNTIPGAEDYTFELADSPGFEPDHILLSYSGKLNATQYANILPPGKIYYWRVKAFNKCNGGPWSPIYTFQTELFECYNLDGKGLPINISSNPAAPPVIVNFNLSDFDGVVSDVNVKNIEIAHGDIGNLQIIAQAPSGKQIILFNNSCSGFANMRVGFDDQAFATLTCGMVNQQKIFKPANPLSGFNGESVQGDWSILVKTSFGGSTGSVKSIDFELCATAAATSISALNNKLLPVKTNNSQVISRDYLAYTSGISDDDQIIFTLLSNPLHGHLERYGVTVEAGDTLLQSWINDYQVVYVPNTDYQGSDNFDFMVRDRKFGYLSPELFNIDVKDANPVRVNQPIAVQKLMIAPNPTSHQTRIYLNHIQSELGGHLKLLNSKGQLIQEYKIPSQTSTFDIDINTYIPGVYYVQFVNNTLLATQKIIKL